MFDWTRDENMFRNFQQWKSRVKMVFASALRTVGEPAQCQYLKYWLGKEGLPLLEHWEKLGKINTDDDDAPGNKLETYYTLLEEECKPKSNKLIAVMQLWSSKSSQGQEPLNSWITKIHNMVDAAEYPDVAKTKIVRDVLISGCSSDRAKDKILRETDDPSLERVIQILQIEDSTKTSIKSFVNEDHASVHYARYDSRRNRNTRNNNSTNNSTENKKCYRCGKDFVPGHVKQCKAKGATCNHCGGKGHYEKMCLKKKNSTTSTSENNEKDATKKKSHSLVAREYYDEDGTLRQHYVEQQEN